MTGCGNCKVGDFLAVFVKELSAGAFIVTECSAFGTACGNLFVPVIVLVSMIKLLLCNVVTDCTVLVVILGSAFCVPIMVCSVSLVTAEAFMPVVVFVA